MNISMKKFPASSTFIMVFSSLCAQSLGNTSVASNTQAAPTASVPTQQVSGNGSIASVELPPDPTQTPTQNTPTQTLALASHPKGQYIIGTYTGSTEDVYYGGNVQVAVTVSGGKVADVQFLQYTSDRSASRYINIHAMPILRSQAIQAQSTQINGVSGASDTSTVFQQSLASEELA